MPIPVNLDDSTPAAPDFLFGQMLDDMCALRDSTDQMVAAVTQMAAVQRETLEFLSDLVRIGNETLIEIRNNTAQIRATISALESATMSIKAHQEHMRLVKTAVDKDVEARLGDRQ